ncbi:MAG: hypothetical protein LUH21_07970 [Clostridiales bacterium]|nr:hypothetical protein [Clostridiales bacterium]
MRMEFEGDGGYRYNGIKRTMINYREAEVDNYTLWFNDVLGVEKMIILCLEMDWHRTYGMKEVNGNGIFTSRNQKIIRN